MFWSPRSQHMKQVFSLVGIITALASVEVRSLLAAEAADFTAVIVEVIDGDTLRDLKTGASIRLYGADACEVAQRAKSRFGQTVSCEVAARNALIEWTTDQAVTCVVRSKDRYGRSLSSCSSNSVPDFSAALIRQGLAVAYRYKDRANVPDYADLENAAKSENRGIWRFDFVDPSLFRAGKS